LINLFAIHGADPKVGQLRHASIFAECSGKELEFLASRMDEVRVDPGQQLTTQGSPGHSFYVRLEGEVEASIDGQVVATLGPSTFFGEISMLDRGPATATVRSTTATRLMVMSHQQFRDAILSNGGLHSDLMSTMARRMRENAENGFARRSASRTV
jgi:CRP-like cAMP-binding protein